MDGGEVDPTVVPSPLGGPLADAVELLAVVVDQALAVVVTMNDQGVVTGWGRGAEEAFGWTAAEAVGRQVASLIVPPRHRADHEAGLARYRSTGTGPVLGKVLELTALDRSGREFPVELAISEGARVGDATTFIAFIRDITVRKAWERRQTDLVEQATRAGEMLRDFSNLAVHELRGPLSVAIGYASMLLEEGFGPPSPAWFDPLRRICEKLIAANLLVDDLMTVARLDAGGIAPQIRTVDLAGLAEEAAGRARTRLELGGGRAEVDAPGSTWVRADSQLAACILDNLLGNAIAYGGRPARLTLRVQDAPAPAIEVTDNGPGIRAEDQERIFERFVRGHARSDSPGTGLGLYLCRRLAELQGGEVALARSEIGSGSTFVLRLPRAG